MARRKLERAARSELAVVGLFVGCVLSAALTVPASEHGSPAELLFAIVGLIGFCAGLIAWVLLADARARRRELGNGSDLSWGSWRQFEREFWSYVESSAANSPAEERAEDES